MTRATTRAPALLPAALLIAVLPIVAACAASPAPRSATGARPVMMKDLKAAPGLEGVIGQDADAVKRLFGAPRLDVVEVDGRKLQFMGTPCILDVYLYGDGRGREIATHVDARRRDGAEVDRAACVAALRRR